MGDVSVLVPYRGDDGGPRDRAWAYVRRWYGERFPGWQIVQGACRPGPWIKAHAVLDALTRTDGDTIICADSDVVCDGVGLAVEAVRSGVAPWATPHRRVYRLTPEATGRVLGGGPLPSTTVFRPPRPPNRRPRIGRSPDIVEAHTAMLGGGIVVLSRRLYTEVPMDPRFVGWGGEDGAWGSALSVLAGRPFRGADPLFHLWHPPQERISRAVGSMEGRDLARRYRATTAPDDMRALLAEIHATPGT